MSQPDQSIVKWLNRQSADLTEEGGVTHYALYHAVTGEDPESLERFRPGDDSEVLAQEIWDLAEHDATTRTSGRWQRYVIYSFRGTDEPVAQWAFKVLGKAVNIVSEDSDPATEKGALGAVMAQNKALHNTLMQLTEATSGRLARDLEVERRKREASETKLMEMFEKMQSVEDRAHEREMEKAREIRAAQRHEQLMGMLTAAAPALLSQFLGARGNGDGSSMMRDESIENLLGNLDSEEVNGVMNALKTHNRIALIPIYQAYRQKREAKNANVPKILKDGGEEPDVEPTH